MTDDKLLKPDIRWWSSPRTLLRHILMLDDTSHSIALGTAVGMFIGMTPTVGIQMVLVIVVAFLTRPLFQFNRMAGLLTVYISNPLTVLPIYWFNYQVGRLFVAGHLSKEDLARTLVYHNFRQWWRMIVSLFVDVGTPLIVGSLVVAVVCGVLTYPLMRWLLRSAHRRPKSCDPQEKPVVSTVDS